MSGDQMKSFFSMWYGKLFFACMTAVAVLATTGLVMVPVRDRSYWIDKIEGTQKEQTSIRQDFIQYQAEQRAWQAKIEANMEWLVKRWGGNPQ